MRRIFKSDAIESSFRKFGYTVIRNFISSSEVDCLLNVYNLNKEPNYSKQFYVSHWIENSCSKRNIDYGLQKILVPRAQEYLLDYIPVFAAMSVKHPGTDSAMELHQDWSHVDEAFFCSLNIWVSLGVTNKDNGSICLVKGSHSLFNYPRGVSMPSTFQHIGSSNLKKYLIDIELAAGDALIWDHRLIHGSRVNRTQHTRLAAIVNMRPRDSDFLLYYYEGSKEDAQEPNIKIYSPDPDFFISYDSVNRPEDVKQTRFLGKLPYRDINIWEEDLILFLKREFGHSIDQSLPLRFRTAKSILICYLKKIFSGA